MATKRKSQKKRKFRYFFLHGELHKILRLSRPDDMVFAWSYPQSKRVAYVWTDVQKNMQHAYKVPQVAEMLNRHPNIIKHHMREGSIKTIQKTYSIDERKRPGDYFFSEDDIKALHNHLMNTHRGRPRSDGKITPSNLPTKVELEAMLSQEVILYVKTKDGEFSPVWKQPDW
jgi:hypothetical protein